MRYASGFLVREYVCEYARTVNEPAWSSAVPVETGSRAAVWLARGTLDSDLTVQGGAPQPLVLGGLTLREGQLSTAALPQLIRDIGIELRAKPGGVLRLERASARTEQGRVRADGGIQLAAGTLRSVELSASIENFPFAAGSIGLWLDTKLRVTGRTEDDTLRVKVNIPSGAVRLPKLSSGSDSDLQPLGPLEDMRFTDAAARAAAAQALRAQQVLVGDDVRPVVLARVVHAHQHLVGVGIFADVGERFLHQAVDRNFNLGGQRRAIHPRHVDVDRHMRVTRGAVPPATPPPRPDPRLRSGR